MISELDIREGKKGFGVRKNLIIGKRGVLDSAGV